MGKKRKTNVQVVSDIMNHSKYEAIAQVFVLEAIRQYADIVSETKLDDFPEQNIINPQTWLDTAKEIREKMIEAYEKNDC